MFKFVAQKSCVRGNFVHVNSGNNWLYNNDKGVASMKDLVWVGFYVFAVETDQPAARDAHVIKNFTFFDVHITNPFISEENKMNDPYCIGYSVT